MLGRSATGITDDHWIEYVSPREEDSDALFVFLQRITLQLTKITAGACSNKQDSISLGKRQSSCSPQKLLSSAAKISCLEEEKSHRLTTK